MRVPSGIRSRSPPAVVTFSPRSPAAIEKPALPRFANSSDGIRWTCLRIGQAGSSAGEKAVPDERASVGVSFHAMPFHQLNAVPARFAEVVPAVGGDSHYPSLEREIVPLRHQAARASERRFWRR